MRAGLIRLALALLWITPVSAQDWRIDPQSSSVLLTYDEAETPRVSQFDRFSGLFSVPGHDLTETRGFLEIDIASFDTDDVVREGVLLSAAWLDARQFPKATLRVKGMEAVATDRYRVDGALTIRNRTVPVVFMVLVVETPRTLRATGALKVNRHAFNLSDTLTESLVAIGDMVAVSFDLVARRMGE